MLYLAVTWEFPSSRAHRPQNHCAGAAVHECFSVSSGCGRGCMLISCWNKRSTGSRTRAGSDAKTCPSTTAAATDPARCTGSRPEELYPAAVRAHGRGTRTGRLDTGTQRIAAERYLQQLGKLHTG